MGNRLISTSSSSGDARADGWRKEVGRGEQAGRQSSGNNVVTTSMSQQREREMGDLEHEIASLECWQDGTTE